MIKVLADNATDRAVVDTVVRSRLDNLHSAAMLRLAGGLARRERRGIHSLFAADKPAG